MKLSENIRSHQRFDEDRGLDKYFDLEKTFNRTNDEWLEVLAELQIVLQLQETVGLMAEDRKEALERLFKETMDMWNMIGKTILYLISELGIAPEQVDTIMELINRSRDAKYAIEYFRSMPVEEAIKVSRDTWEFRRNGHY